MISVIIDYENENEITDKLVIIKDKNDVNHLKNSFRVKVNEKIRAVDGEFEYILNIIEIEKKEIVCEILEKREDNFSKKTQIDVALGMLKNDKMNLAIQKLTEIGINGIIPYFSKRCIVKINEKKDKWDLISKETLKQCQGVKFVNILEPISLSNIKFEEYDLVIVPYEEDKENNLKNLLKEFQEKPKKVLYIIGPEGGFETGEIAFLKGKGCKIVTLGNRILRAETAAIVVGGVLVNEFE
ncbi:MAG: 16S rRNA (uracil(1498)-N(3))-methyltransferase [Fusobacteriaceae bacterium]|nr:16S rRNA (uracil(1498)-N(3))-methyltransferase [Fusobacteriaceae bacterium]